MKNLSLRATPLLLLAGWPIFVLSAGAVLLGAVFGRGVLPSLPSGHVELAVTLIDVALVVAVVRWALELSGRWQARSDSLGRRRELWLITGLALSCQSLLCVLGLA